MTEQLELFPQEETKPKSELELIEKQNKIEDAEWCFQFFNNEPIVFAYSNEGEEASPLVLQLQPNEGEGLNFQQNGMTFRIFPRPISEESKKQRIEENVREVKEA